jgi:hypothetical protein
MGSRFVNVIGVRPAANSFWASKGNWQNKSLLMHEHFVVYINNFFLTRKVQNLGLLLNRVQVEEKKNSIVCYVHLFDPKVAHFKELLHEGPYKINKSNKGKLDVVRYLMLERLLLRNLRKIVANNNRKVSVVFVPCDISQVSALLICNFIRVKLRQRHDLKKIVYPMFRYLRPFVKNKNFQIGGVKIECSGRFSKRDRGVCFTVATGRMPHSSRNCFIDYYFDEVILKYGICGIKVWVYYPTQQPVPKQFFLFSNFSKKN